MIFTLATQKYEYYFLQLTEKSRSEYNHTLHSTYNFRYKSTKKNKIFIPHLIFIPPTKFFECFSDFISPNLLHNVPKHRTFASEPMKYIGNTIQTKRHGRCKKADDQTGEVLQQVPRMRERFRGVSLCLRLLKNE